MPNFTNSFHKQSICIKIIFLHPKYFHGRKRPGICSWTSVHTFPWLTFSEQRRLDLITTTQTALFFHSFIHHCGHCSWQWHFRSWKKRKYNRVDFQIYFFFFFWAWMPSSFLEYLFKSLSAHFFFARMHAGIQAYNLENKTKQNLTLTKYMKRGRSLSS